MDEEIKDLGRWTWYTAKFLNSCENGSLKAAPIITEFLIQEGFQQQNSFRVWNQATVLMALYGLFVIPKEFWRNQLGDDDNERVSADQLIFENFEFTSRAKFNEVNNPVNMQKEVFLRRFRNSIAHANIEIDKKSHVIRFTNTDRTGNVNFNVTNNLEGLSEFLGEIGKYFINEIS